MSYIEEHRKSGIRVGDTVEVIRRCSDNENGWQNSWIEEMDRYVGTSFEVVMDDGIRGFSDGNYSYPYFVLRNNKIVDFLELNE